MKIKWLALLLIVLFFHDGYSQKIDWNDSIPKYISATGAKLSLNKDFVEGGEFFSSMAMVICLRY